MAPRGNAGKGKSAQKAPIVMAPRGNLKKNTQHQAAELKLLEDENYARLKIRLDEFERSMDLSMMQMNSRLAAELSPNAPTMADLNANLTELRDKTVTSIRSNDQLGGKICELERKWREIHERIEKDSNGQLGGKIPELESRCREMVDRMEVELGKNFSKLESKCKDMLGRMEVEAEKQKSKFESKCREMLGRMEVKTSEQLAISPYDPSSNDRSQDAMCAPQKNLDSVQEVMRKSEEAVMKNWKELEKHKAELGHMKSLGQQLSDQIADLDKLSRQNQDKLAGQASQITFLFRGGQSVANRQDEVEAYPKSIIIQTKKCNELGKTQHHNLTAAVESLKQWVVSALKKEIKPISEQAKRNSSAIKEQRDKLDLLNNVKPQLDLISEAQRKVFEKLATIETIDLKESTQIQSIDMVETERITGLMKSKCEELFSVIQRSFNADLESLKQKQSNELLQQSRQLQSMLTVKAEIEGKIIDLIEANKRNENGLSKAKSDVHSLIQQSQVISQRQNDIAKDVSKLSREKNEELETPTVLELMQQTCNESLKNHQRKFNADLESLKQHVLSVQKDELRPIVEQAKQTSNEIFKHRTQLDIVARIEGKVSSLEKASETTQSTLTEANSAIRSLIEKTELIQRHQATLEENLTSLQDETVQMQNGNPDRNQTSTALPFPPPLIPDVSIVRFQSSPQTSSPISIERDDISVVGVERSQAEGSRTQDHANDESNEQHDVHERPSSKRSNLRARSYTDEESDSSPAPYSRSTSRAPGKLTKNQKWRRETRKNKPNKGKRESLRKERESMEPSQRDDDITLSNAVHAHIRIITGLPRKKGAFLPTPTLKELDNMPQLEEGPLSVSAKYKVANVTQTWDPEDEMGDGFSQYCLRRIKQYGLPFVGISTLLDNPKALEWNRRTVGFLSDTFYHAVQAGDYGKIFRAGYDIHDGGLERAETLIRTNLDYRIAEMTKYLKRADTKSHPVSLPDDPATPSNVGEGESRARRLRAADEKKDRIFARRVALGQRRYQTACAIPEFHRYRSLFLDKRLCSSDESNADADDDTRIRHAPVWRSSKATALVERIDKQTQIIRANGPSKAGRKPGKRLNLGAEAPLGGLETTPCRLPEDVYGTLWMNSQSAEQKKALQLKPAIFDE
ncbi:uncharacterized protein PGTG_19877 [Puccinia graminis f. sp. tritici CRL 75-36-700-3]|uniref:Uncharacterized protein n=1 Tax=Puccinia graminis f. sp. tritici (strain CRL 75-36-700-3 / race SCCL) TaxID=418459 RepID=E3LBM2_PUCGT|nr:uncharacterized protein PGTG_19877 [Puccinia graminis f. sp. tritici CRL 75-36-700-3]EFP93947.2 hypothetical protein PGTG_19877 [Puccinia graminis f. sp. tritici CRL 75-36-700-3]